jgi:hypothetical protein
MAVCLNSAFGTKLRSTAKPLCSIDDEFTDPILQGEQTVPAQQTLRRLWQADELAKEVGADLGRREVLLGCLPEKEGFGAEPMSASPLRPPPA